MKNVRPAIKFICGLFLLLCTSCQEILYYSYQPVNSTGWYKKDTLIYTIDTLLGKDEKVKYQIGIRHKDSYNYRDLWLRINHDTIHIYLADSIGKWFGHGIGELRQITFPYHPTILSQDTIKELRINHIMKDDSLSGIHDIGISIHKYP